MKDVAGSFVSVPEVFLSFEECPECHCAILSFIHDGRKLVSFIICCTRCGCTAEGYSWRETLRKWNSGEVIKQ